MFGDYKKAIGILEEIKGYYQARAEHATCGHRASEADSCIERAWAISECQKKLQQAWDDEEKAYAKAVNENKETEEDEKL